MNRKNLYFGIGSAIVSCFFLWFLIFIWGKVPSTGIAWGLCLILIGILMFTSTVVIITGFTSIQYESTRKILSFIMGVIAVFITNLMFKWRWNEWFEYLIAFIVLVIVIRAFNALLENKKFQRSFEALLITLIGINMLRIIPFL